MPNTIKELSNLAGRKALITGAAGNLGKIFADTLAELGADLILVDLHGTDLKTITTDLTNRWGVSTQSYYCDLEIQQERTELLDKIKCANKSLNILVNNAAFVGTSNLPGWAVPFEDQSIDSWRRAIEVNLTATFDLCQGLYPLLKSSIGGSIVNIASIYGMYGPDLSLYQGTDMNNPAAYSVSKGGLIQLTRWLSTSIAPEIRVNAISPGGIFRNQPTEFVHRYESNTPLGRMAKDDDFRGALAYLCSDLSKYVSGQVLAVDGAWGVW